MSKRFVELFGADRSEALVGMNGHALRARVFSGVLEASEFAIDCNVDQETGEVLPSMTRQEFAAECDVNELMARYEKTGILPVDSNRQPMYVDFADVPSYHEAWTKLREAEAAFMLLPAPVRAEFQNDPGAFVAFAEKVENIDKLREWGLAPPAPVEPLPLKVEVVNEAAPPPSTQ